MNSIAMKVRQQQPEGQAAGLARTVIERQLAHPARWVGR